MSQREAHPTWVRPGKIQLEGVLGDCLNSPIEEIRVTTQAGTYDDPRIEAPMRCNRYPDGLTIEVPFPLVDAADTHREQTELGLDSTQLALDALCNTCHFRSMVR